ncbi:MAG: protein jag [Erysipelotrichaceae bacterium]|nr:protein jag [Erysipelotrichaceae bacterium]
MRKFINKTEEAAVNDACVALNMQKAEFYHYIVEEKKGLFSKKVEIAVFTKDDVFDFIKEYIRTIVTDFGLDCEVQVEFKDPIISVEINTNNNSLIIGKNGITLQMFNELVKAAVNNTFRTYFRILLNVADYKDNKYSKLESMAKKFAHEVLKTKQTITLDPMPADERRVIHNILSGYKNIKTESVGEGLKRQLTIKYID